MHRLADRQQAWGQLVAGFVLIGVGEGALLAGGHGSSPFGAMQAGLAARTGLSILSILLIVGALIIAVGVAMTRQKPGPVTLLAPAIMSPVVSWTTNVLGHPAGLPAWFVGLAGILVSGAGCGLYLGAALGRAPLEIIQIEISRRSGLQFARIAMGLGITATTIAIALRGPVGVLTLVQALSIGPIIQTCWKRTDRSVSRLPVFAA